MSKLAVAVFQNLIHARDIAIFVTFISGVLAISARLIGRIDFLVFFFLSMTFWFGVYISLMLIVIVAGFLYTRSGDQQ